MSFSGDIQVKEELNSKESTNGSTLKEERKRKLDELPVTGNANEEDPLKKENGHHTDVNGNEGPESKKRKITYTENGGRTDTVSGEIRQVECYIPHTILVSVISQFHNHVQ